MANYKLFHATLMPDEDWWHALWPDPSRVVLDIGIKKGANVVDLCCGDGYFTKPICELSETGIVYGVDLDLQLLEKAKNTCSSNPNFRPICGDALELPQLVSQPVDLVLIANTFHGVPKPGRFSEIIHQALNDEGRFVIVNWYRLAREETTVLGQPRGPDTQLRMDPEEVRVVVEAAGFVVEDSFDVGPYHYAAIFRKLNSS